MAVAVVDPGLSRRPLTREQYDILTAAGAFDEQRVQLLERITVDMAPQGPEHGFGVARLATEFAVRLFEEFGRRYEVRPQVPLAATPLSEPEPDPSVIDRADSTPRSHPSRAHVVIGPAQSSRRTDLGVEARIYSAAGVTDRPRRHALVRGRPSPLTPDARIVARRPHAPGAATAASPRTRGEAAAVSGTDRVCQVDGCVRRDGSPVRHVGLAVAAL